MTFPTELTVDFSNIRSCSCSHLSQKKGTLVLNFQSDVRVEYMGPNSTTVSYSGKSFFYSLDKCNSLAQKTTFFLSNNSTTEKSRSIRASVEHHSFSHDFYSRITVQGTSLENCHYTLKINPDYSRGEEKPYSLKWKTNYEPTLDEENRQQSPFTNTNELITTQPTETIHGAAIGGKTIYTCCNIECSDSCRNCCEHINISCCSNLKSNVKS